jgi:hypothetical protein
MSHAPLLSPFGQAVASSGTSSLPAAFSEQLSRLYAQVQRSPFAFGSPIGPFTSSARSFELPRFVYFGPNASDAALRLCFLAGFNHRDLRSTLALLRLIESVAVRPDLGEGLNLSFFPLVDLLGLAGLAEGRDLEKQNWIHSNAPEISLLEKDARHRAYHGFIRLETAPGEEVVSVLLRSPAPVENAAPELELFSSADLDPVPVRWEREATSRLHHGPLSIADDLLVQPFELAVRIPAAWPLDLYAEAAASILKRLVLRYRGFMSYAQHL